MVLFAACGVYSMELKPKKITALGSGRAALADTDTAPLALNKDLAPRRFSTTARRMKPSTR